MSKRVLGALLLVIIGGIFLFGGKFLMNYMEEKNQRLTSDAVQTKGRIRIAMDSWIGYYPLCSRLMKDEMHRSGWILECVDDNADYPGRMSEFEKNNFEFAVATIDSYLLNGEAYNFPGSIIAVIDESKGGDAIVARKEKVDSLNALRGMSGVKVASTPDSPSHFLLKATADHFDLPNLLPSNQELRIETEGSEKAYSKILSGTTDVAALWEPDVSKALSNPAVVKLLGTEDTERLIVDILLVNRKFMQQNPEVVSHLLRAYFKVLKKYRDSPETLHSEIVKSTGLKEPTVLAMLKGVKWINMISNCEDWFGISAPGTLPKEQLSQTIYSVADILVNSGDFQQSPIPQNDSYRLIKRTFLENLYTQGMSGFTNKSSAFNGGGQVGTGSKFPLLDSNEWEKLKEVGTLKLKPISFRSGSAELDMLASLELDQAAEKISHYPRFRVVVKGHTGTKGDSQANLLLSQKRADSVTNYLVTKHGFEKNRLLSKGFGSKQPLKQEKNESIRAYQRRLLRVELVLVREDY